MHIQLIRVFSRMREMLSDHKDILNQLERMQRDVKKNKEDIELVFETLKRLLSPPP